MTQEQINDVALAARMAAIGQAQKNGDRCVFAIVVCGLEVGAPLAVQTNVKGARPADVVRILQNGIHALQNRGGGLILLAALLLWVGAIAIASGCGSVTTEAQHDAVGDVPGTGTAGAVAGAGASGGIGSGGMAGGAVTDAAVTAGSSGGTATGGTAGDGTAPAGSGGMTGAIDAGMTCAARAALCYQCPPPAPICSDARHGAWTCCDQIGRPACDLTWCRQ